MEKELYSKLIGVAERIEKELSDLFVFVSICSDGLQHAADGVNYMRSMRELEDALKQRKGIKEEDGIDESEWNQRIQKAKDKEEFAQKEFKMGFPYLYQSATVRIWSILETFVDDVASYVLRFPDFCDDKELIRSIEGPLIEFIDASYSEQSEFLVNGLKKSVRANLKLGVGRFESLLKPLGLGGSVHEDVRKVIFEISQLRNVIAHRNGNVDAHFVESCPWLRYKIGENIKIDQRSFSCYMFAALCYYMEVKKRVERRNTPVNTKEIAALTKDHGRCLNSLQEFIGKEN